MIIERYLLKAFLKVFLILLAGMTLLTAIIGLVERYPDISEFKPPFYKVSLYLFYNLPASGGYLLPMLTLLSIIYTLGQASRHREILIISASGGRLREIFKPFIIAGMVITLVSAVFTNILMPESKRLSRLILEEITKEPRARGVMETAQGIWFRSGNRIIKIGIYEPHASQARDIGIYEINNGFLIKRIEAREGFLKEDEWDLKRVRIYNFKGPGERPLLHYDSYRLKSSRYSLRLLKAEVAPEEMDSSRLWKYIRALKKSGLRNIKVLADFNLRLSLPLACLAMMLTGIYLSTIRGLSGLVGAGIGIVISVLFWFGTTFMLSLGYSGVLPAWLAPWITPLLTSVIGIYLYRRIE
ncbi:MAG: LptF/LptG family permease [Thermodesulfovibrionales bacterium]